MSHALRVRGLKPTRLPTLTKTTIVARSTRAWIETGKLRPESGTLSVARSTRAWIETFLLIVSLLSFSVARSTRAWIETDEMASTAFSRMVSHALRVRGLKPASWLLAGLRECRRTLYACVD